jgi:uroporphyrinogen-III synthase
MGAPLEGVTVALPETRELDLFASMLEERGAETWRCPLVSILDTPDRDSVDQWLQEVSSNGLDWMILLTGEGLRRLVRFSEELGVKERFIRTVDNARRLTRGPKPGRALREIGLRGDIAADEPTTDGVIATLRRYDLAGRRMGVQLYGEPNPRLIDFLTGTGARVLPVAPYVYASAAEDERVLALMDGLSRGAVDVIAFTSKAQVERLMRLARSSDTEEQVKKALRSTVIAAVGPVVADSLRRYGFEPELMPEQSYFMKPLVREIVARFAT